jgi:predicted unusual protein kinase regulating ubiquinone biosynthesis (AarF/ABC1/UbiB family)
MYVKILQALAGASDLFSDKVQEFLCEYSDNVPYNEEETNRKSLLEKLKTVADRHSELEITNLSTIPIHSGTVSLVYSGTLGGNKPVAVKVIRPNGAEQMTQAIKEFQILSGIASMIPALAIFRFDRIMEENKSTLMRQFSTYTELNNLLYYASATKNNPTVKIPYAYEKFTLAYDDILVMEYVDGRRVEEIAMKDKEEFGYIIAKQAVLSIMEEGLYHGDLHRGNVLFRETKDGQKQICLLDFGIVGRLSEQDKLTISSFYMSLGLRRYEDAIDTLISSLTNKDVFDELSESEQDTLVTKLENIASTCCETAVGFGPHEIGQINRVLASHKLCLAPVFCKIELALAMNASVSKSLETENTNITTHIRRIITETVDVSLYDV